MLFSFIFFLIIATYCIYTDLKDRRVNYKLLSLLIFISFLWDFLFHFNALTLLKWLLIFSIGLIGYILVVYLYKKKRRIVLGYGDFIFLLFALSLFDFVLDLFLLSWILICLPFMALLFKKIFNFQIIPLIPLITICVVSGFWIYITFLLW
jgi:Flp pilus assembly protein protease CpaA